MTDTRPIIVAGLALNDENGSVILVYFVALCHVFICVLVDTGEK